MTTVVVDSGPLIAAFNVRDTHHAVCAALLNRTDVDFVVPVLCIGETAQLLSARSGWDIERRFIAAVSGIDVSLPAPDDWRAIADQIERYSGFDIGAADASVIVLAERLGADIIATLDHRHFRAIRPRHVESFTLLPEL